MRGGNAVTLHVEAVTADGKKYEKDISNPFEIKGMNPAKPMILSVLADKKYKVIVRKESNFNQFAPDPNIENRIDNAYYPLQGVTTPADMGLMQINRGWHTWITDDAAWNWIRNIENGKYIFDGYLQRSVNLDQTIDHYDDDHNPILKWPGSTPPSYEEALKNAYNLWNPGGHYYKWELKDKNDPQSGYWKGYPPHLECYADDAMNIYDNPPADWNN